MDLLQSLIVISEKAANIARLCRQNKHLFKLLIQQKSNNESNPRFIEDFKTLADVLIQEMVKYDIGNQFPELRYFIQGEENNIFSNILGETIQIEIKPTVEETANLLKIVLNGDKVASKLLATEVHRNLNLDDVNTKYPEDYFKINLSNLGIWIDPIDSTAEYISGIEKLDANGIVVSGLKCVTVLIGVYDKETKNAVMGIINQPFNEEIDSRWYGRCIWGISSGSYKISSLNQINDYNRLLCISNSESDEIKKKLQADNFRLVEASGAGYKILTVIDGIVSGYILSKNSTFKWDTCGPQAILRSLDGDLLSYKELLKGSIVNIQYGNEIIENNKIKTYCNNDGIIAFKNKNVLQDIIKCFSEK